MKKEELQIVDGEHYHGHHIEDHLTQPSQIILTAQNETLAGLALGDESERNPDEEAKATEHTEDKTSVLVLKSVIASLTLHSEVWLLGRDTNQRFLCKDLFHLSKMSEGETQTKPYAVII